MHSGFQIPETEHQQRHPFLISMNQTHFLEQIHHTQQLFLDPPLLFPPHHHQTRLSHQYVEGGAAAASSPFLPVNFKLGLNEICSINDYKHGTVFSCVNGSEARLSSHGIPDCWQNQEDFAIKQQPFWETLASEASNENSNTVDREMNQKEALKNCLESKSRVLYGELEEVYRHLAIAESDQTGPCGVTPSEASTGGEATASMKNGKRKRRKKRKETIPMGQFFEHMVKQIMHHQENLQRKLSEVIERLDEERREREEAWRNEESARFEQEADERAREKASAAGREAAIVSYLEKITGQRMSLPPYSIPKRSPPLINASEDF